MIARVCHGRTRAVDAAAYRELLECIGLRDYRATPGNRGAWVLSRAEGDVARFLTISFWESRKAIARFAGEDVERARYYEEDESYLLEFEHTVTHYNVTGG